MCCRRLTVSHIRALPKPDLGFLYVSGANVNTPIIAVGFACAVWQSNQLNTGKNHHGIPVPKYRAPPTNRAAQAWSCEEPTSWTSSSLHGGSDGGYRSRSPLRSIVDADLAEGEASAADDDNGITSHCDAVAGIMALGS